MDSRQQTISEQQARAESPRRRSAARKAYRQQGCGVSDELVVEHLPMVAGIAEKVVSYLRPPLDFEDLVAAGAVGLVKAARDYDPSREAEFKTYAYIRIKGAIIDELRAWSFVPSGVIKQLQEAEAAYRELAGRRSSAPSDAELAEALGVSVEELYRRFEQGRAQRFLSLDGRGEGCGFAEALADGNAARPGGRLEKKELTEQLAGAIEKLPVKQRRIVVLYYHQGLTMKQIGRALGVSESRVSQLHAGAIFRLSVKLKEWKG